MKERVWERNGGQSNSGSCCSYNHNCNNTNAFVSYQFNPISFQNKMPWKIACLKYKLLFHFQCSIIIQLKSMVFFILFSRTEYNAIGWSVMSASVGLLFFYSPWIWYWNSVYWLISFFLSSSKSSCRGRWQYCRLKSTSSHLPNCHFDEIKFVSAHINRLWR